jgi:hypothetical protein
MKFARKPLQVVLRLLARYPRLKRRIVDLVYLLPAVDTRLRDLAHRAVHPEARLDVDASRMSQGSQRCRSRIRAGMPH